MYRFYNEVCFFLDLYICCRRLGQKNRIDFLQQYLFDGKVNLVDAFGMSKFPIVFKRAGKKN